MFHYDGPRACSLCARRERAAVLPLAARIAAAPQKLVP